MRIIFGPRADVFIATGAWIHKRFPSRALVLITGLLGCFFLVLEFNRDRQKRPRIREQQTYECGIELRLDEVGHSSETTVTCDAVLSGIGMRNNHRRGR